MGSERESATHQQSDHLNAAIKITEGRRRQHGSGGNPYEGVNHVPDAVDYLDLVGDKFNDKEKQGHANHPPTGHNVQLARKLRGGLSG